MIRGKGHSNGQCLNTSMAHVIQFGQCCHSDIHPPLNTVLGTVHLGLIEGARGDPAVALFPAH